VIATRVAKPSPAAPPELAYAKGVGHGRTSQPRYAGNWPQSTAGAGDIVSGRINYYRWIPDAGWTREPGLDQLIADGGYPGGGGFNLMGNTLPEQNITVTGNSQRLDAVAINILQGDGGTAVPVIYIQSTVR
jgi:hypothetical protein